MFSGTVSSMKYLNEHDFFLPCMGASTWDALDLLEKFKNRAFCFSGTKFHVTVFLVFQVSLGSKLDISSP